MMVEPTALTMGIVGFGVVGRALHEGFKRWGHRVMVNDVRDLEFKTFDKAGLVDECDVIFICVPTGSMPDGSCDLTAVYKVFEELWGHASRLKKSPVLAIKSTVIPGTVESISKGYKMVCSNPEFMRADSPLDDFLDPARIIVGTTNTEIQNIMGQVYRPLIHRIRFTTPTEAEAIKYLSNAYLVGKVAFSQEIAKVAARTGSDPDILWFGVTMDERIHPSHLNPRLGRIAADSPCLPKDLKALIVQLEKSGDDPRLLREYLRGGVEESVDEELVEKLNELLAAEITGDEMRDFREEAQRIIHIVKEASK